MTFITLLGYDLTTLMIMFAEFGNSISKHILVFDDAPQERFRMKQFQEGILAYSKTNNLNIEFFAIKIDEDSKSDMSKVIEKVKELATDEIMLHTSEAYAATSLILSNLLLSQSGKILTYDNREDEYHVYDGITLEAFKPNTKLTISEFMQLLNYTVLQKTNAHAIYSRKKDVKSLFNNFDDFKKVRLALMNMDEFFDFSAYSDIMKALQNLEIVNEYNIFDKNKNVELGGGLFEEYIFWLCEPLGFDDIAVGVKVDVDLYQKESDQGRRIINELDIVMTKNNTLYTIECKFSKNLDGLSYIYKYDAIMDYFGENVKGIILNVSPKLKSPYLDMKESSNFRPSALRRAKLSNLHIYHEDVVNPIRFTNFVTNFFR